jgi:hypothetical protein
MKYCSECGTQIEQGIKFCPNCGHSLNKKLEVSQSIQTDTVDKVLKNSKSKKKYELQNIEDLFTKGKNLYFTNDIPWKKLKNFLHEFEYESIKNFEYFIYYYSGWQRGGANGFALCKNENKFYLLVSSFESKQVLVKVIAWDKCKIYELNKFTKFQQSGSKLYIEYFDVENAQIACEEHSIPENKTFEELNIFCQNLNQMNPDSISNGLIVDSEKIKNATGLTFIEKFAFWFIPLVVVILLLAKGCQ